MTNQTGSIYDNDVIYQDLFKIREKLTPDRAWTQHAKARNSAGEPVPTSAQDAVCWCVFGAWYAVEGHASSDSYMDTLARRFEDSDHTSNIRINDRICESQADILLFLDWCIATREWELENGVES